MNRSIYLIIISLVISIPFNLLGAEYQKEMIRPLEIDSVTCFRWSHAKHKCWTANTSKS